MMWHAVKYNIGVGRTIFSTTADVGHHVIWILYNIEKKVELLYDK